MKTLSQYINEGRGQQYLFESFGCETAEKIFSGCGSAWEKKSLGRQFTWDQIPEEALEEMDCAAAKKLAYKQNATNVIFWLDSSDRLMFVTHANYSWSSYNGAQRRWNPKSVKRISETAAKAILLKDEEKYSTKEIRRERTAAKANALALKTADEVRNENIERYKKAIAQAQIEKSADTATMLAKLDSAMEEYNTAVSDIMSYEIESLADRVRAIQDLNQYYSKILECIRSTESRKEDAERSRRLGYGGWETSSRWLENIIQDSKKIDGLINELKNRVAYWKGKLA